MSDLHTAAAELLQDAAARIERVGLRRDGLGNLTGPEEPLCSINTLLSLNPPGPVCAVAFQALDRVRSPHVYSITAWSDNSPNDQVVIDAMQRAAKAELRLADGAS